MTGTGVKFMKNGPKHIMDAEDLEPLYTPQENILEECLRREAERVAHQENLMNRVVFDSVNAAPSKLNDGDGAAAETEESKGAGGKDGGDMDDGSTKPSAAAASSTENAKDGETSTCDNDQILTPYY